MNTNTPAGSSKEKIAYICENLQARIRSFNRKATWYQAQYFGTSMATLGLSFLITVITGLKTPSHWASLPEAGKSDVVLVCGALITIVSGWGMFYSPKDSWLIYASSLNRLRQLNAKIEFMNADPKSLDPVDERGSKLYGEYQAILDAHNKAWLDLRATTTPPLAGRGDKAAIQ